MHLSVFQLSLWVTVCLGSVAAIWLFRHKNNALGAKPLALFCGLMAIWCSGHLFLLTEYTFLGELLVLANPLLPTAFLHFALVFTAEALDDSGMKRLVQSILPIPYFCSIFIWLLSLYFTDNHIVATSYLPHTIYFGWSGWINLAYTVVMGVIAHGLLAYAGMKTRGNVRRSVIAMFFAGGWGFVLASSFIFPSLDLDIFPYLFCFIPTYVLVLVFAVVRYHILEVNQWAVKTIFFILLLLVVFMLVALVSAFAIWVGWEALSEVKLSSLWFFSFMTTLVSIAFYRPARWLATQLIFPGSQLSVETMNLWGTALNACQDHASLCEKGAVLISDHLKEPVRVVLGQDSQSGLVVELHHQHDWFYQLNGWENTTPALRHVAEVFSNLMVAHAKLLEKSLSLAKAERQRQEELRLVEIGSLSAAMAHEIRNPLNIISMASAQCDPQVKVYIQEQVHRADHLIQDLLSYARVLNISPKPTPLNPMLESICALQKNDIKVVLPNESHTVFADPYKLQQVLTNLLDNAFSFAALSSNGCVCVTAKEYPEVYEVGIHNNGPEIEAEMTSNLFKPFISKRPGGSGLGLAIVRRIMDAHDGDVSYRHDLGWPVSFIVRFPKEVL